MEERIVKCIGCSKECIFYPEWNTEGNNLYCHQKGNYITESHIYDLNILKIKERALKEIAEYNMKQKGKSKIFVSNWKWGSRAGEDKYITD